MTTSDNSRITHGESDYHTHYVMHTHHGYIEFTGSSFECNAWVANVRSKFGLDAGSLFVVVPMGS